MSKWQPGQTLEDVEREVIEEAFKYHRGNKTHTANALDIAIRTLDNKLTRYAEEDEERKKENGLRSEGGLRLQSGLEFPEKPTVPMQKREEVQKVLSPETPAGSGQAKQSS